ncbi:DUF4276 family protein [Tenacibaculum dicentrarchi]|uniref:DUF4276 family protein n=1 Tax=Tenacibaculum dicentrarchi TaxID=669041 RepID=UPI003516303E
MKRLIIICEGQTEIEFCKDVLNPHFLNKEIFIQTPLVKKSGGGIVPWPNLKKQIENHLLEQNVFVTTFIDYYGIPDNYNFPKWSESKIILDKNSRMDFLEKEMKLDLKNNSRFIPYIQLHEFEGLLFNNIEVFDQHIAPNEFNKREDLINILELNPNPELINNNKKTAPSKRLQNHIIGYNKIVYGSILAESIGLTRMRNKSPRFNEWLNILECI